MSLQKHAMQISVFLIALFLYPSSAIPNSSFLGDGRVLMLMKETIDDPYMLDTWTESDHTTHCSWTGVQCDHVGRVVALNLSNMGLSGPFSDQVTNLLALRLLNVSNNHFYGSFPSNFSKLRNLEVLDVSNNYLRQALPPDLSYLIKLRHLDLGFNFFSGSIPGDYGKLKNVEYLSMSRNVLRGRIPGELGNLGNLKMLYLGNFGWLGLNTFDGGIPPEIGNLSKLVNLDMDGCGLSGEIPSELGGLKNLETMSLQGNGLTGEIPSELGGLKNLETMSLRGNGLTGEIPVELSDLNELRELDLSNNKLTGILPQRLGVSGKLLYVYVISNRLTGPIPPNLCKGGRLQILAIQDNSFIGPIPEYMGTCNSLNEVFMGQNYLNGSIHAGLLYLPNLTWIDLGSNYLTGSIPEKINDVSSVLQTMNISNNRLSGSLPSSIGKLSALQVLEVSGNKLTGTIPLEISNCSALISIDLSGNRFSGMIPREIRNCINLTSIDISQNELRGPIPVEISKMALSYLDVSRNHFNESIPIGIQYMQSLYYLDFSYNNFSGIVKEGSLFWCLDPKYFAGNPYLSGPHLDSCSDGLRGQARLKPDLLFSLGSLLFCSLLLAIGAAFIIKARAAKKEGNDIGRSWEMTNFQILDFGRDDIVACIKEENIIGKGGAGLVYRGIMPDGQQIAVKKLTGIGIGSSNDRGFSAEIQTLGKIRHKHIVKLLAFCSNPGTNLLVYEYMPNRSLGEMLHGNNGEHLHWDTRYKIAVEAAKGLCYLHHDCCPVILHRDVKSNNILLSSNFEAHVADFGLAKLLHHSGTSTECMSSIAGTFGYIAPEYVYTLKVGEKSDVYSFGVVLLELITGKKPVEDCEFEEGMNIAGWAKKMTNWKREEVMKIIDPKLSSFPMEEAKHMFFVALLCLEEQPVHRPSMREIVYMFTL